MGSCSLKGSTTDEKSIHVVTVSPYVHSVEEEKQKEKEKEKEWLNPRASKLKQKGALVEMRKGSIPVLDAPTAKVEELNKSKRDIEIIEKSFDKHFIFNTLTTDQRATVINAMKHYTLDTNQYIFHQNQLGSTFFIVTSGLLEVLVNDSRVNTITEGQGFGELALMHDTPRTATVKTLTPVQLWGLDRITFRKIIEDLNALNFKENKAFIETVPVFSALKPVQIEALLGSLTTLTYASGQIIVKEGDVGNLLFIIKEGMVLCTRGNVEVKKFGKGDYFGEQALIHNSPRTATCIAITQVKCLSIDRNSLNTALGSQLQVVISKNTQSIIIEKHNYLKNLSPVQAENLINAMEVKKCLPREVIASKNSSKAESIIMVLKGKLKIGEVEIEHMKCLGVDEIIENSESLYEFDIVAEEETDVAVITKQAFENCIGGKYELVTNNNEAFKVLKQVQLLRGLSDEKLQALITDMKIEKYNEGDVIVEQNSIGDSFYIVKSGKVDVFIDSQAVRTITKHDYFGERSVIFGSARTATVIAKGSVECWVLFQVDFLRTVDQGLRTQLMKRIELQDDNLTLNDLAVVKLLGKGMFGNVFLVIHKTKKVLYALKTVDRKKIAAYELHESLLLERQVLLQLDHIFIMKLVKTLEDEKRVYFVLEYVKGMDLFDVLRKMQVVSEADSRFFIGCLIVIFQHLHDREIIYRDLKPENVVVDEDGYLKLIDFGTAKIINGRTYTIVGTPHYMAPEVILRKGYGVAVDYWSIGIVLYELLFEKVPFADSEDNPMAVYEIVLTAKLKYPRLKQPMTEVKSLINQLLNKNPSLRKGGGFEKIRSHAWFAQLDWEKLMSKLIHAPYIPKVKNLDLNHVLENCIGRKLDKFISREEVGELPEPNIEANSNMKLFN